MTRIKRPAAIKRSGTLLTSAIALATVLALSPAAAQSKIKIESQPMESALNQLAQQVGKQIVVYSEDAKGLTVAPLEGTYTEEEALSRMLDGTGLDYKYINDRTIAVGSPARLTSETETARGPVRVAQADTGNAQDVATVSEDDEDGRSQLKRDEIIVTGTNIRGVEAIGAASMTFGRVELENTGFGTIGEFFESLPQNLDELSSDGAFATGASDIGSANRGVGAASISLRGLGPGSTLTLLNGKRRPAHLRGRVIDVSAIPLSMIERVEVVTGGRSAVYGSDAVAGVVNIVTRTAYDGAETQVYYGGASAGGERFNISQTFGREFDRGGFVFGYDYSKEQSLEANDAGVAEGPTSFGRTPIFFNLQLPSEQHVGLFSGHYNLNDNIEFYADAHFSTDETEAKTIEEIAFGLAQQGGIVVTKSKQFSAVGGVRWDIGQEWQVDFSVLHGAVDNKQPFASLFAFAPDTISLDAPFTARSEDKAKLTSVSAIADGSLGTIGNSDISAAIGIEFRSENYDSSRVELPAGTRMQQESGDRDIWSVFGEIYVPLINRGGHQLDVSIAGRYDNYSDFGDTFNPQFGLDWRPVDGLTVRGSYSTAFRAPDLFTLAFPTQILLADVPDPLALGGTSTVLGEFGGNSVLQPEEADTWTVGFDWTPLEGSKLSFSYFNIKYDNRIDVPEGALIVVLTNEDFLPGLINRSPTSAQLAEVIDRSDLSSFLNFTGIPFDPLTDDPLAVFPGLVSFDGRSNNISIEEVDGIDFRASTVLETGFGDWSLDVNGTYYLNFTRNITPTAPAIDQLNSPGKLVDFRLRGHVGWSKSAWSINAYVNYVDDYVDTIAATPTKIESWTTVDLTIAFDTSAITDHEFLSGFRATLGIDNLFDEDPPLFRSNIFGITYDTANADAIGRFVSFRLSKSW